LGELSGRLPEGTLVYTRWKDCLPGKKQHWRWEKQHGAVFIVQWDRHFIGEE
jgi:hypothetical protein